MFLTHLGPGMKITVNGNPHDISAQNLADLLIELGYSGTVVATAINQSFVPVSRRAQQNLAAGDQIEILAPMQGG